MLILHLITDLESGGAENQLQQLVLASQDRRFRHVVLSLLDGGFVAGELKAAGIEVHSLGMRRRSPSPAGMVRLSRLLHRLRPDLLHCWLYHACLMGELGARLVGVPRVTIWGLRSANLGLRDYSLLTKGVVRLCAGLSFLPYAIVLNSEASRIVHEQLGYSMARMGVIPNGIDAQRFSPNPEARRAVRDELGLGCETLLVGMFARFSPMKDHRTFLKAAALVHGHLPNVRFILAGEQITFDNEALSKLVRENDLKHVVYLLGPRRDIPRLTAALDLSCLSSWSESFPNVVVEAMACAVPSVVTDAGDASMIVGDPRRTVNPRDALALSRSIYTVLSMQPSERAALGQRDRERVLSKFTVEKTVSAYEHIYDESSKKHAQRI